jgi:hypothetical protein
MVTKDSDAAERLGILLDQEEAIQFESFDLGDAWSVGSRLVELGGARGLPIDLVTAGEALLELQTNVDKPGASPLTRSDGRPRRRKRRQPNSRPPS